MVAPHSFQAPSSSNHEQTVSPLTRTAFRGCRATFVVAVMLFVAAASAAGQPPGSSPVEAEPRKGQLETPTTEEPRAEAPKPLWHYGGFLDLGYAIDFNFPENHLFRNRSTTPRVNELDLNMGAVYVKKDVSEQSRWGPEFLVQGGQDAKDFGFAAGEPKLGSADQLRHFGRANVSYLAPVGNGLTVQAGLFNSLIGYDSLYAKDNFSYTRPWGGDYTPYLMFGVNASYPISPDLMATLFVINGYAHLSNPNSAPSYGGQIVYKASERLSLKETVYYGPDQGNTSIEFWRLFSDSIAEWKGERLTVAFEYQIGTEVVDVPGNPRTFWTAAQLPVHYVLGGPWSATVRPEFYWD